ncbi:MAG: PAS domain-containing protein, partial [Granulosicoccaceae bacterium]
MPALPPVKDALIPSIGSESMDDNAWVEVIHSMENIYAELVEHQVELENKNAALEESQRFISSVLSAMNDVLIVCDMQGEIQECNAALLATTGRQASDLIGRPFHCLFPEPRGAELQALFDRNDTAPKQPLEVEIYDQHGELVPLLLSCTPRVGKHNRQVGRVITGHPIGELQRAYSELNHAHEALKEAQHQLIQSEKMASLGRLVAGVAHELNNPISFVVGNVHVLQR